MNIKQLIYKLIDNKYNDNKIDILIDRLINYPNDLMTEPNNLELENKILTIYNALKYNYKKHKHLITQISIIYNVYYISKILLNTNFYKYFSLNNNINNLTISCGLIDNDNLKILCSSLKNNLNLKVLNLSKNIISDLTPLNDVLNINIIKEIDLSCNRIDNIDILGEYLKNNTSLKILDLNHNLVTDFKNFFESIQNNKTLKRLIISNNEGIYNYNDVNIYFVTSDLYEEGLNSINYLNVINKYLQNNNSLQELYIENPYCIGNYRIKYFFKNWLSQPVDEDVNQEEILNKYHYDLSNIFKTLEHNNSLQLLSIDILNNTEYYNLCNLMKINTSIKRLHIADVLNKTANFNHDFHELFDILKYNDTIQELYINIMNMNKKEIKSLSELLKYSISLKKITIIINTTPYNDLYSIYRSLEFNKKLEELTILDNKIVSIYQNEWFDLYPLCKTLYFNKSIKKLTLYSNGIKNFNLLIDLYKSNHHLKGLSYRDKSLSMENDDTFINNFDKKIKKSIHFNKKLYNDF